MKALLPLMLLSLSAGTYAAIHSAQSLKAEAQRVSEVIQVATDNPSQLHLL